MPVTDLIPRSIKIHYNVIIVHIVGKYYFSRACRHFCTMKYRYCISFYKSLEQHWFIGCIAAYIVILDTQNNFKVESQNKLNLEAGVYNFRKIDCLEFYQNSPIKHYVQTFRKIRL